MHPDERELIDQFNYYDFEEDVDADAVHRRSIIMFIVFFFCFMLFLNQITLLILLIKISVRALLFLILLRPFV